MTDQIPDQHGRVAVVTGANSGLGLVTATELARHGAHVVLAVRDTAAGERAARAIDGDTEVRELDLASLRSVRAFAAKLAIDHPAIDLLVNNAGVVLLGPRRTSADGFELQLATNALGHFALTGLLLGTLAAGSRVVNLSSITHKNAHLDFDDLMLERGYRATTAYGRSKLATTVFGLELDRRLRSAGLPIAAVLAHPGLTRTNLTPRAWEHRGRTGRVIARLGLLATQPVERGALPQLYAATAVGVRGGQFFGPAGLGETRGRVGEARLNPEAADPAVGRRLWAAAEELTGVSYL
ncbi:oxidoreductase [Amycolatopsis sp. SID8362]|uniref:oxidoreductase n=1 Tax=Amycolatopsis sp. SID8362 TaxID=2690346 RepID=UPI001370C16B|nr:oxidoreductase [Amycolatopsis sp. SID8362]NBH04244.1 SDR family NAD(P)-dependent oxidoreductase [Amycolatopsis sp. SID8362]NED40943.1 SDR family NAD(P)-dependent oxidoreductase [Amycolatopsis sp. SID8362]